MSNPPKRRPGSDEGNPTVHPQQVNDPSNPAETICTIRAQLYQLAERLAAMAMRPRASVTNVSTVGQLDRALNSRKQLVWAVAGGSRSFSAKPGDDHAGECDRPVLSADRNLLRKPAL